LHYLIEVIDLGPIQEREVVAFGYVDKGPKAIDTTGKSGKSVLDA